MKDLIHVGKGQREPDLATINADEEDDAGIGDRPEVVGRMEQIIKRDRVESPVPVQALVVKPVDCLQFLPQILHVNRADRYVVPLLEPVDDLGNPLGRLLVQRNIVGVKSPHHLKSRSLVNPLIIRRVPRHRDKGWPIVSLGQDAAVVVDGGIIGPSHHGQPLLPEDCCGGIEKGPRDLRIVDEIEKAKEAHRVLAVRVVRSVDDRGDAADRFAVAVSDERSNLAVRLQEDRFRPDQADNTTGKRRRERRIRSVYQLRNPLESLHLGRSPAG